MSTDVGDHVVHCDAVAQWSSENSCEIAEVVPASFAAVPEGAVDVLDALIEDWTEVLTAHR